jgi:hypothetical protein
VEGRARSLPCILLPLGSPHGLAARPQGCGPEPTCVCLVAACCLAHTQMRRCWRQERAGSLAACPAGCAPVVPSHLAQRRSSFLAPASSTSCRRPAAAAAAETSLPKAAHGASETGLRPLWAVASQRAACRLPSEWGPCRRPLLLFLPLSPFFSLFFCCRPVPAKPRRAASQRHHGFAAQFIRNATRQRHSLVGPTSAATCLHFPSTLENSRPIVETRPLRLCRARPFHGEASRHGAVRKPTARRERRVQWPAAASPAAWVRREGRRCSPRPA